MQKVINVRRNLPEVSAILTFSRFFSDFEELSNVNKTF